MQTLDSAVVQLFYQLANAFFWPVAVALLALLVYSAFDLGALFYAMWRKRREPVTDLSQVAAILSVRVSAGDGQGADLDAGSVSPAILRFWNRVEDHILAARESEDVDLWLCEALRREQLVAVSRLDRSRMFVRIGPMLGLCGTIIPLGPALQSLLGGDMAGMVSHLVVGFGAVVCGLVMSGISYYITLVRERWTRMELKDMEDFSDLLMRAIERRRNPEVRNAAAQQA